MATFCSCKNPTPAEDKDNILFCRRCNKDIEETLEESARRHNLVKKAIVTSGSPDGATIGETQLSQAEEKEVKCPFCYHKHCWTWDTNSDGKDDEAMCQSCETGFEINTGKELEWSEQMRSHSNKPKKVDDTAPPSEEKKKRHYCTWKGNQYECIGCNFTCSDYSTMKKHEDPSYVPSMGSGSGSYSGSWISTPACSHKPTHVIDGGEEGWGVWAGKKWDVQDHANKYDVVLNLTGDPINWSVKGHRIPIPELSQWSKSPEVEKKYKEIVLDWPDMGVVTLPIAFWQQLVKYLQDNKYKMLTFCMGGHGRTGTAIASLLVTSLNWEPEEAVKWVKENYCKQAIETYHQTNYVYRLVGQTAPKDAKYRKGQGKGPDGTFQSDDKGSGVSVISKNGVERS